MATNFGQIRDQLTDFNSFGLMTTLIPPPPEVQQCWQWNTDSSEVQLRTNSGNLLRIPSGCPIFDQELQEFERYIPRSVLSNDFASTPAGGQFTAGMAADIQEFRVDLSSNPGKPSTTRIALLRMIYQADIKKIRMREEGGRLVVNKITGQLQPYDAAYPQPNITTTIPNTSQARNHLDIIADINLNGARGFYGPRSERCRHGKCNVTGPCVDQSATVEYGPDLLFQPRKRFTCEVNNVVYLLYCNECLRLGLSTTYCGETEEKNCHQRFGQHTYKFSTRSLNTRFPKGTNERLVALREVFQGVLEGDEDPDRVMQDPYSHFTLVHPPTNGNDHRRYVFIDGGFPSVRSRKLCEMKFISFFGAVDYNYNTHSGNLNHM
ncbi:hypothetical protein Fcan01_14718 [Folsomia candida]|uniref:Uncharacterized protein n=1 Tax=Folsomia candida TaxID=158441 RepID=A0A226E1V3_FOLCA|nr:hypothetical protein Fcan01_14718 [Folsomia candida]